MKYVLILFFGSSTLLYSQTLHHQMLGAQGTSKVLSNGTYISQSIGQQSVIGNYTKDGITYGQGFQQSVWSKYIETNSSNSITTITYPNPFVQTINFQFSKPITDLISIMVFDIRGRLIYQESKLAVENILTIELPQLASSNYLVKLSASNYTYYSQILKQ
ncbi:T9SS type A sorting domain-containing protein [Flavobacterium aciduliphilum]|uniref:Putative secreted protein (Por secretion system target) n=1 Tax=Flavobacterium aciduliphilum TaxID=1101402 RepID=A0A328YAH7_9FLAO|nr:T9SS type A sorting domain-containing protein [Flavobacterium aciduliphilum]RAR70183.1 putative secreted protein (Por secretion system target) [Flavobacterium aciduliphilum]